MYWKICRSLILTLSIFSLVGCTKISSENNKSIAEKERAALVNIELGLGYLTEGQRERAKLKLVQALKLAPQLAETHSAMAYFLEKVGDLKEAEREHKKAIKLVSNVGAIYNNYGAFLCRKQQFKEADLAFQVALKDKSYLRMAEVYENAGLCALQASLPKKAEDYLQSALKQDPNRERASIALAHLRETQGRNK